MALYCAMQVISFYTFVVENEGSVLRYEHQLTGCDAVTVRMSLSFKIWKAKVHDM